ncbi:MAG: PilC/PilY family type IV pilus protein [Deltaproteobacteria bacterium]|nr:PilC/PilY family type IV pilus protein [Deltaproteobacteria bacterium]
MIPKIKKILFLVIILGGLFFNPPSYAQTEPPDESVLFTTVAPDTLVVLDLSGSMLWTPAGERMYINGSSSICDSSNGPFYADNTSPHTTACDIYAYGTVPKYGDTACTGNDGFYRTSGTGHTTDCSRVTIAKRSIFDILDDNDSNDITSTDEQTLNIRFGYMRFYNCSSDDTAGSYSSGCNSLIWGIASKYSRIYCNNNTSCSASSSSSGSVSGESASGGTPLASALNEAKLYLDYHKSHDSAASCRQKFVILVTDGADTFACSGDGSEGQSTQYKRRRETVAKAKALADAGYKVFVVGFGTTMPHYSQNTLNWAAYYGGTDNPLVANSGMTSAYNPSSVTSCQNDYLSSTPPSHNMGDGDHYYADSNDPGEIPLSGYAFLATSASSLTTALKQAIAMIREASYSFSLASVSSQRTQDENHLYEASFQPLNNEPFWLGHLKKYAINSDGSVGSEVWDAGSVLQATTPSSRTIKTYKSGSLISFEAGNISASDLGLGVSATTMEIDAIVGYFRGESSYNPEFWKLGDIFHSNPVTIGTPSPFFEDIRDDINAFATYRTNHQRTSALGNRIIVAGGNDGQFHVFLTSTGDENWSFIPPNLLPKLKNIAHSVHPTGLTHQYFVDGPITAADVWWYTGADGTSKSDSEWRTLLIFGEGRGGGSRLWSSSSSCDSGFNATYTSTYSNYCGYYAFDFTNTLNPVYQWRINVTSALAPYMGDPWSKFAIGRVKINGNEKWVGFVGAGYNASDCAGGGGCDSRGKGFYVVDLSDGSVLWSYTRSTDSSMNYSLPASPAIVDTDNDGFIDTAYIANLGGSLWRFKFCTSGQDSTCDTSNWSGGYLFQSSTGVIRPIFSTPSVSKDQNGNLWVHWGTGDKTDPAAANAQENFYAVKDNDRTTTYNINDLDNITSSTYTDAPNKHGWYITLAGMGEKVLGDATVFGGVVYFTSYVPPAGGDPCSQAGEAKLFGVNFTTGAGVLTTTGSSGGGSTTPVRSISIGTGIATTPIISFKPLGALPPDLYVTVSGGAGSSASTTRVNFDPPTLSNRTNLLYWKDRRLE